MGNEHPPQQPSGTSTSLTNEFDRQRQQRSRNGMSGLIERPPLPQNYGETSVGTDIGNFFKVLLEFLAGLWNRDMTRFELMSSVYFPPTEEKPPEGTVQRTIRDRVDRLNQAAQNEDDPLRTQPVDNTIRDMVSDLPTATIPSYLPNELLILMNRDRHVRQYVEMTQNAVRNFNQGVDEYNKTHANAPQTKLNEVWVVRQFFQESRFNPNAVAYRAASNGERAVGISQFLPSTAAQYGVTAAQLRDPKISIETGVRHMGRLTNQYGSQIFALFAYSGGDGALKYAAESLVTKGTIHNRSEMTANQVMQFYRDERARLDREVATGKITRADYNKAWAVESLDYVSKFVAPDFDRRLYAFAAIRPVGAAITDTLHVRDRNPATGDRNSPHRGTDYGMAINTPILATNQALVVHTGRHLGYGKSMILAHGHGVFELYAHLNDYAAQDGQIVRPKDMLAYSGNTGNTSGPHLHHEWWLERGGKVYVVDDTEAQGKNLKDPAVQDALIASARAKLAGHSAEATISDSIPANIRNMGAELTNKIQEHAGEGRIALNTLRPPNSNS